MKCYTPPILPLDHVARLQPVESTRNNWETRNAAPALQSCVLHLTLHNYPSCSEVVEKTLIYLHFRTCRSWGFCRCCQHRSKHVRRGSRATCRCRYITVVQIQKHSSKLQLSFRRSMIRCSPTFERTELREFSTAQKIKKTGNFQNKTLIYSNLLFKESFSRKPLFSLPPTSILGTQDHQTHVDV